MAKDGRQASGRCIPIAETESRLERDGLDALLGFQLRLAHVAVSRDFKAALRAYDVTHKQAAALWLIGANPGVSQGALATALRTDRASMMATVDRLAAAQMVQRERSAADRRRHELRLTLLGQRVLAEARAAIARSEQRIASRLAPSETEFLLRALKKLSREG